MNGILILAAAATGLVVQPAQKPAATTVVNVRDLGARADGESDDTAAIQRAIDRASEHGGRVVLPPSKQPYLIRQPLVIGADNVELYGPGATIKFAGSGQASGPPVFCIIVGGNPRRGQVRRVAVRGLTIDANCWAGNGAGKSSGLAVRRATELSVEEVTIRNAYVGMEIGLRAERCRVIKCLVTHWDRDAFLVLGSPSGGGARDVHFVSCRATGSRDEDNGGPPGHRHCAWHIDGGCWDVELVGCEVYTADGRAFAVFGPEPGKPLTSRRIRFDRCRAGNVHGYGWYVTGSGNLRNPLAKVKLASCRSDARCAFFAAVDELAISGGQFNGPVLVGMAGDQRPGSRKPGDPARRVSITDATLATLKANLTTGTVGDQSWKPSLELKGVTVTEELEVYGDRHRLRTSGCKLPAGPLTGPGPWRSLFDGKTLKGWKITDFGGQGDVYVKNGTIVMEMGADLTGITWTGPLPHMDYEVSLEAKRVDGSDFFCGLTFPVRDSACSFIVGGWGGSVTGISCLDGMDASENETTGFMSFKQNRWYKIRVRVTKAKIEAWIDDEKTVDVSTVGRKIDVRIEVELSKPFGIACWQTTAALRNIRIRRLPPSPEPKE